MIHDDGDDDDDEDDDDDDDEDDDECAGAYNPEHHLDVEHPSAPAFSMRAKSNTNSSVLRAEETPGPGSYDMPQHIGGQKVWMTHACWFWRLMVCLMMRDGG